MLQGSVFHPHVDGETRGWASTVAIAFALIAGISFAVDLTISLGASLPAKVPGHEKPLVR